MQIQRAAAERRQANDPLAGGAQQRFGSVFGLRILDAGGAARKQRDGVSLIRRFNRWRLPSQIAGRLRK